MWTNCLSFLTFSFRWKYTAIFCTKLSKSSKEYTKGDGPGYNLDIFGIRHQQVFSSTQPIKVKFGFRQPVGAAKNLPGFAPLVTFEKISFSNDRQRQLFFDKITIFRVLNSWLKKCLDFS